MTGGGGERSLTVLMTADAVGGVWNYALALCAALPQHRFVLALMGPAASPPQRDTLRQLSNVVLEEGPYRLEWMEGAAADLPPSRQWLAMLARRHRADLLHVNGYAHGVNDSHCPAIVVAHSDVCSWWRAVHREEAPAPWDDYRREAIAGLTAADRVVAPTAAVLDDLARHYRFPRGEGSVVPNGIDLAAFSPASKQPAIMAAGRLWDEAKNLQLLDDIAGDLDWPVEIAGAVEHPERGVAQFRNARLLGVLDQGEMAARLGATAIFAAPARYEPFGLGILEAAACGCGLVLGDIPSLRELWDGAALFVMPDDRLAWRTTLACLIADEERRQALAAAARERARRFSREAMAHAYAALYREMTADRASRREVA